jgi:hypothetical protein
VGFQVVANFTLLGPLVSRSCPHCGEAIFDQDLPRRSTAVLTILASILLGVGLLGTMVTGYNQPLP